MRGYPCRRSSIWSFLSSIHLSSIISSRNIPLPLQLCLCSGMSFHSVFVLPFIHSISITQSAICTSQPNHMQYQFLLWSASIPNMHLSLSISFSLSIWQLSASFLPLLFALIEVGVPSFDQYSFPSPFSVPSRFFSPCVCVHFFVSSCRRDPLNKLILLFPVWVAVGKSQVRHVPSACKSKGKERERELLILVDLLYLSCSALSWSNYLIPFPVNVCDLSSPLPLCASDNISIIPSLYGVQDCCARFLPDILIISSLFIQLIWSDSYLSTWQS